jgi:hypothetical protein
MALRPPEDLRLASAFPRCGKKYQTSPEDGKNCPGSSLGFIFKLLIPNGLYELHKILGKVDQIAVTP